MRVILKATFLAAFGLGAGCGFTVTLFRRLCGFVVKLFHRML